MNLTPCRKVRSLIFIHWESSRYCQYLNTHPQTWSIPQPGSLTILTLTRETHCLMPTPMENPDKNNLDLPCVHFIPCSFTPKPASDQTTQQTIDPLCHPCRPMCLWQAAKSNLNTAWYRNMTKLFRLESKDQTILPVLLEVPKVSAFCEWKKFEDPKKWRL